MTRLPPVFCLATGCSILGLPVLALAAQQFWLPETFNDLGFSVRVPPAWQVSSRPEPGKPIFAIFRQVSSDLLDDCRVMVAKNQSPSSLTQEQLDLALKNKFFASPVPDYNALEIKRKTLEENINKNGGHVQIIKLDYDKLAGHPSIAYTMMDEQFGRTGEFKQFSYVHTLLTPERLYTIICSATSHDMNTATMEFGNKIYAEIIPFIASFTLLPLEAK